MNSAAIACSLNISTAQLIKIEEWASVLWVKFVGGCRFVSKKIGETKMKLTTEKRELDWVCRSEVPTANKYFPDQAWVAINQSGIIGQSKEAVGTKAPSQELINYALSHVKSFKVKLVNSTAPATSKHVNRRGSCLNCGITNSLLLGRGYCTDCHGEC